MPQRILHFFSSFSFFSLPLPPILHRCSLECAVRDGKPSGVANARPPTTSRCCMRQLERSTANLRYIITHHRKLRPLSPTGKYCQGHSTATARDLTKKIAVGNMSWTFCVSTLPSALCNPFPQKAKKNRERRIFTSEQHIVACAQSHDRVLVRRRIPVGLAICFGTMMTCIALYTAPPFNNAGNEMCPGTPQQHPMLCCATCLYNNCACVYTECICTHAAWWTVLHLGIGCWYEG